MKNLSLSIVICFVLAFLVCGHAPAFAKAPAKESEASEKKDDGGGLFGSSGNVFYVKLDPMIMPIIGERGVKEVVSMVVSLQVTGQRNVEIVNNLIPRLNDAYVRALYGNIDRTIYRNGRFLDVTKLKNKLMQVTVSEVGKELVQDVLIQGVSQREFN